MDTLMLLACVIIKPAMVPWKKAENGLKLLLVSWRVYSRYVGTVHEIYKAE